MKDICARNETFALSVDGACEIRFAIVNFKECNKDNWIGFRANFAKNNLFQHIV